MSFILGSVLIGAGASVASGIIGSKGAKDAASTAAAGSDREIEFNRESRDLARADQAPYREAGARALNALESLVGIGGGPTASSQSQAPAPRNYAIPAGNPYGNQYIPSDDNFRATGRQSSYGSDGYLDNYGRANGGPIAGKALYNVNELGPESIYSQGGYTRGSEPRTLQPDPTGYVHPNVQGRAVGGPLGVVNPNQGATGGSYGPGPKAGAADYMPAGPQQAPQENPGGVEGGYNFQTDPGYGFRKDEGMRALEGSAAARGGLGVGLGARNAPRFPPRGHGGRHDGARAGPQGPSGLRPGVGTGPGADPTGPPGPGVGAVAVGGRRSGWVRAVRMTVGAPGAGAVNAGLGR